MSSVGECRSPINSVWSFHKTKIKQKLCIKEVNTKQFILDKKTKIKNIDN